MKTICFEGSDDGLATRIALALGADEQIVRWRPEDAVPPHASDALHWLFVVDCRGLDLSELPGRFRRVRKTIGPNARCLAIASGKRIASVDVITAVQDKVTTVLIWESESVVDVIRAELNDKSGMAAAATALTILEQQLPAAAHRLIATVLTSGFRVDSVNLVALSWHEDRGTVNRAVHTATKFTAKELVDLTKASFAVLLLRGSTLSTRDIALMIRLSGSEVLNEVVQRTFALSALDVRTDPGDLSPSGWLAQRLVDI